MLQVQLEGKLTPMLGDTGAAYTCVSPRFASHLDKSGKFANRILGTTAANSNDSSTLLLLITEW